MEARGRFTSSLIVSILSGPCIVEKRSSHSRVVEDSVYISKVGPTTLTTIARVPRPQRSHWRRLPQAPQHNHLSRIDGRIAAECLTDSLDHMRKLRFQETVVLAHLVCIFSFYLHPTCWIDSRFERSAYLTHGGCCKMTYDDNL
jgi:hypothetical protein